MSPKWAKKAHFDDISYNVFNRRKSSYLMIGTLHFTTSWRLGHFNESNHQKWVFDVYSLSIHKNQSVRFWCYRVYQNIYKMRIFSPNKDTMSHLL